jgi:hypothetical protein
MRIIAVTMGNMGAPEHVCCEIENFRNELLNMIERGVDCASRKTDAELCA